MPDNEDLLWEILLRLPPQPFLPSARLRGLQAVAAPRHKPQVRRPLPRPPPEAAPPRRLPSQQRGDHVCPRPRPSRPHPYPALRHATLRRRLRHSRVPPRSRPRHGRWQGEVLVCDPVTGEQHRVAVPAEFRTGLVNGAVLCPAADDQGHVHGGCPFKVVLMTMYADDYRSVTCVYSSETGIWGDLVKTAAPCELDDAGFPGVLVGNALYWLQLRVGKDILMFDLDELNLAVIEGPPITNDFRCGSNRIIQAEDGAVGLAVFSYPRFQIWQRNVNCHGVATWMLWKTIEMHNILGLPPAVRKSTILGYCEDTDAFFIFLEGNVYMVQLKSMQSKRLHETQYIRNYHPFTSFYTPGMSIAGGSDEAELHET